jgi:RNA polymerase sigma-70 factor (ECF subfamily)
MSYGAELYGVLLARLRSETDASEVYATFAEDLWRGLPNFEWRSTLRTYCYTLAYNAASRYLRAPAHRRHEHIDSSDADELSVLVAHARTQTASFLKTESRSRLRALRERLDPADEMLLVLHVDRGLRFEELAVILNDGAAQSETELMRETARLRKRFQLVKGRLKRWAESEGLLDK